MQFGFDMRRQDKIMLWPNYFDSTKTRLQGRRIPKNMCVPSPKLDDIQRAAAKLGLRVEVVPDARHPQTSLQKTGLLIVSKSASKTQIIKSVAKELSALRSESRI